MKMIKKIYDLLSEQQRSCGVRIVFAVLLRALLDFAGVAALIPMLLAVLKPDGDRRMMLALCGAVLIFVMLKNGLVLLLARMQSRFLLDIYKDFSRRMFENYYHRGLLFLKSSSSLKLGHEVNYICYTFSLCVLAPVLRIVGDSVLVLLMMSALVVWEPVAGLLLCAAFLPLAGGYIGLIRKHLRLYGTEELEARRKQLRTVVEAFRGFVELEIAYAFDASVVSFEKNMESITRNRLRMELCQLYPLFLSETAVICGLALLVAVGRGDLGLAGGVFAIAAFRLLPAIRNMLNSWGILQNASHTINIVANGITDTHQKGMTTESPFSFCKGIELHEVNFAFPDGCILFRNLNLNIKRGERIGIRGASGSGKSTLFNLMLGFLFPASGEICIDGRPLTPANRKEWHRIIGYVPQDIFVAEDTLAANIALGQPKVDYKKVMYALEQAQLKEWVEQLPQGLDTPLGEFGNRLSGGQKQRIGIARALYKKAEVLFFDEATSALDQQMEHDINHALQELSLQRRDLTLVIIAHRESSLAFCDRIFDLDNVNCIKVKKDGTRLSDCRTSY